MRTNSPALTVWLRRSILMMVLCPVLLRAQDVATQYLRLQESYSQRLQDLEQEYESQQRELFNKFILALVRTEQTFREEGNLDGVMVCRELRDTLLQNPSAPVPNELWPMRIQDMVRELGRRAAENRSNSQAELNKLNQVLLRALEPYKIEFTRQGSFESALEIRDVQTRLSEALGVPMHVRPATVVQPTIETNDPNAYPFLLEGAVFLKRKNVAPRSAYLDLKPEASDEVELKETGYVFDGGTLKIEAELMEFLRTNAARNHILTIEFGVTTPWPSQGSPEFPAGLFLWGESLDTANLAITQEGTNLFLYFRTSVAPSSSRRSVHRIDLGPLTANEPSHVLISYRANDSVIYRNGTLTQRLRGAIHGGLTVWQPAAAQLGRLPATLETPDPTRWYGEIHQLCIKAGQDASRQADNFATRFRRALSE